ncbi:hypothetical protein AAFF_G00227330 [Aldrovandia affinis]|uniref:C-type lectin domain-containing protein n=1 Tax=Aldrovandia affinis TaxID=143900 RepID=A0AAD7TBI5_9TELE|nr:hypothetical protein AAFF_G00227330 [Aldrovandia affinis]
MELSLLPLKWGKAKDYCRQNYTDLFSMLNEDDMDRILDAAAQEPRLTLWVNRDPLEYRSWSIADNYQCPTLPRHCGALSITERVWESKPYEEKLNFICYTEF